MPRGERIHELQSVGEVFGILGEASAIVEEPTLAALRIERFPERLLVAAAGHGPDERERLREHRKFGLVVAGG